MSVWLEKTPENIEPKNVVAMIMSGTTSFLSQPERQTPIKQIAGIIEARINYGQWVNFENHDIALSI